MRAQAYTENPALLQLDMAKIAAEALGRTDKILTPEAFTGLLTTGMFGGLPRPTGQAQEVAHPVVPIA